MSGSAPADPVATDTTDHGPAPIPSLDEERADGTDAPGPGVDSPGADLFKRWLWLPGPVALAYLATTAVRRPSSATDSYLVLAVVACLPAQVLAWSWASRRWLRWKDWRFIGAVVLAGVHRHR
jgi:hypothetical protein